MSMLAELRPPEQFNLEIPPSFEPVTFNSIDRDNLIALVDNPNLKPEDLPNQDYPEHSAQLWKIFSPDSELTEGSAIPIDDSKESQQYRADIKTLVNAFSEIQQPNARSVIASMQVKDAYKRLNNRMVEGHKLPVPADWKVNKHTGEVVPFTYKDKESKTESIAESGMGDYLIRAFRIDKFKTPEVLDTPRVTRTLRVAGQVALNKYVGREDLSKVFKPKKLNLPEEPSSENPKPKPEPIDPALDIVHNIRQIDTEQAKKLFPDPEEYAYFMSVKNSLEEETDKDDTSNTA